MQNLNNPPSSSVSPVMPSSNGHKNGSSASASSNGASFTALNGGSFRAPTPSMNGVGALPAAFRALDMEQEGEVVIPTEPNPPRGLRMRLRFWRIFFFAVQLFARLVFWQMFVNKYAPKFVERTNLARWRKYARSFKNFAIETGGVMIKAGQFISTRVDILPPEVTDELAALRDTVPTIPNKVMMKILEQELGTISARFSWFAEEPLAAASLGQVYRARLLNGDRVVVKIQRPGIDKICHTDLSALNAVARFAMNFSFVSKRADAVALAREFGRVLLEELSYKHELRNAHRFTEMFKDDLGVYIPTVYKEHSTDRLLTIEDVTTIKINDYEALERSGISRKEVAKRLMDTYLTQIFEERFFHADPHPGNLFIYPLPQKANETYKPGERPFYLIFIDFGMTGTLTPQIGGGLISTLTAVVQRDARGLIKSYQQLGFLTPDADLDRIEEATRAVFNTVWGLSMNEMANISYSAAADLGKEFNDLIFAMPFQVPQDFIYLGRTVSILSGMCTAIDPTFNPWSELQPFTQKFLVQTAREGGLPANSPLNSPLVQAVLSGNAGQALMSIGQQVGQFLSAPSANGNGTGELMRRLENGELRMQVEPNAGYKLQLRRIELQSKRTTRAVIFGGLVVASTLLYTNGDLVPAVVGYVLSGVAFLTSMFGD